MLPSLASIGYLISRHPGDVWQPCDQVAPTKLSSQFHQGSGSFDWPLGPHSSGVVCRSPSCRGPQCLHHPLKHRPFAEPPSPESRHDVGWTLANDVMLYDPRAAARCATPCLAIASRSAKSSTKQEMPSKFKGSPTQLESPAPKTPSSHPANLMFACFPSVSGLIKPQSITIREPEACRQLMNKESLKYKKEYSLGPLLAVSSNFEDPWPKKKGKNTPEE